MKTRRIARCGKRTFSKGGRMKETLQANLEDLERSRLTIIFIKITTHLKSNLQDMFRSYNDHLQLKVELI